MFISDKIHNRKTSTHVIINKNGNIRHVKPLIGLSVICLGYPVDKLLILN